MSDRIDVRVVIREIDTAGLPRLLKSVGARAYTFNGLTVIVANEPDGWHMSVAHPERDPTWDELVTARYRICAHVTEMAMHFPPLDEYVNSNHHCFHLHEVYRSPILLAESLGCGNVR